MTFLADGAMGTELLRRGRGYPLEALVLDEPEVVRAVHAAYRVAGAQIITAHTFGANRYRLAEHGLAYRVAGINREAVRLARAEAGDGLVVASVGPSGLQPAPTGVGEGYREQAAALAETDVDGVFCETFGDTVELREAVIACLDAGLPVVAHLTFGEDGRTPLGLSPGEVVTALSDLPLAGLGVNCAVGTETAEGVIREMAHHTDLPLSCLPNAGQPRTAGGELRYPMNPTAFGDMATRLAERCVIVGGCCGTTPAHIAAARRSLGARG